MIDCRRGASCISVWRGWRQISNCLLGLKKLREWLKSRMGAPGFSPFALVSMGSTSRDQCVCVTHGDGTDWCWDAAPVLLRHLLFSMHSVCGCSVVTWFHLFFCSFLPQPLWHWSLTSCVHKQIFHTVQRQQHDHTSCLYITDETGPTLPLLSTYVLHLGNVEPQFLWMWPTDVMITSTVCMQDSSRGMCFYLRWIKCYTFLN